MISDEHELMKRNSRLELGALDKHSIRFHKLKFEYFSKHLLAIIHFVLKLEDLSTKTFEIWD